MSIWSPNLWIHLKRAAIALLILLILTSLAIAIAPEAQPRPLIPASGVIIDRGFIETDSPRDFEVRKGMLESPYFKVWRSWNPTEGSVPGNAHTIGFRMPAHMAIAYQGFAGEVGIDFYLECIGSGERLDIASARTNTQWSEVLVSRPPNWCAGDSRLVVHSDSHDNYIAFGTPFKVSTLASLKTRALGLFATFLLAFCLIVGVCLASTALLRRMLPESDPIALGMIGLGAIGYAMFFIFYFASPTGRLVVSLFAQIIAAVWAVRWLLCFRHSPTHGPSVMHVAVAAWRAPVISWLLVSTSYFLLLYSVDNGAGPWLANARFAPVRWSTDNQLPMLIGEYLTRLELSNLDLGPWLVSDRTPLSYGLHAWLRSASVLLTRGNDGAHIAPYIHTMIGVVLNTAWVPVLTHILRSLGLVHRNVLVVVATATFAPFCLFNSIYIWPKLLGGSFGLLAIWVLLVEPRVNPEGQERERRWVVAAVLSALALLSHGGTVFGIVAMLLLAFCFLPMPSLRSLMKSGMVAAAFLLPWMLWQGLEQPHGNALLKSVFAGTYGFDERSVGVFETIQRSYQGITLSDWLGMKLGALKSLSYSPTPANCGYGEMVAGSSGMDAWRISDFLSLAPSLGFLWLGLLALTMPALRKLAQPDYRPACIFLGVGLLGVLIDVLLAWDCQIIHTQSYQSILSIMIGLLLLILKLRPAGLGLAAVSLTIGYGMIVWVYDPIADALRVDSMALSGYILLAAATGWFALKSNARVQEQSR